MGIDLNNLSIYFDACSAKEGTKDSDKNVGNVTGDADHLTDNYVKRCLKNKILEKRQKRGLGKIEVDFTPTKVYPMTEEEEEKDRTRRQCNRRSAHKSRQKQKEENEKNELLLRQLKKEQKRLLTQCTEIETEKNKYGNALIQILPCDVPNKGSNSTCENNTGLLQAELVQKESEAGVISDVTSNVTVSSDSRTIYGHDLQFSYGLDTFKDSEKYIAGGNYIAEYIEVVETEINEENLGVQIDQNSEVEMPVTYITTDGSFLYTTDNIDNCDITEVV